MIRGPSVVLAAVALWSVGCGNSLPAGLPSAASTQAITQPSPTGSGVLPTPRPPEPTTTDAAATTGPLWGPFTAEVWISWLFNLAVALGTLALAFVTYAQGRRAREDRLADLALATKQAELALRVELAHAHEATAGYLESLEAAARGAKRTETFHDSADAACQEWRVHMAPFELRMLDGLRTLPTAGGSGQLILSSYWRAKRWAHTKEGEEELLNAVRTLKSGLVNALGAIEKKYGLPSSEAARGGLPFDDEPTGGV